LKLKIIMNKKVPSERRASKLQSMKYLNKI
jgi:hypothetical protein